MPSTNTNAMTTTRPTSIPVSRPIPRAAIGALALALTAGLLPASFAQQAQPAQGQTTQGQTQQLQTEVRGSFDQPLNQREARRAARAPRGESATTLMMMQQVGDQRYEITMDGESISAKINGEPVPSERIRQRAGVVEILSGDGDVLATFSRPLMLTAPGASVLPALPGEPGAPGAIVTTEPPPPVMLGVTMGTPDESLAEVLGLEPGQGILVERVVPGLPADKAGLRPRDIIVAVGDTRPIDNAAFRAMLRERKPGDTLDLTVFRRGREEKLKVALEAFDADRLGAGAVLVPGMPRPPEAPTPPDAQGRGRMFEFRNMDPAQRERSAQARERLEDALRQLRETDAIQPEALREQIERALEEALAAARTGGDDLARRLQGWVGPDAEAPAFVVPNQRQLQNQARMQESLDRLSEQLERLNRRLDDMERRMGERGR